MIVRCICKRQLLEIVHILSVYALLVTSSGIRMARADEPRSESLAFEAAKKRCLDRYNALASIDCNCRMFWYIGDDSLVKKGGHKLTSDAARAFASSARAVWLETHDSQAVRQLTQDIGVPDELLDGKWNNLKVICEGSKLHNRLIPDTKNGAGLESVFDGVAEWSHMFSSQQITVYDHSPKLGHFDLRSLCHVPFMKGDWKQLAEDEDSISFTRGSSDSVSSKSPLEKLTFEKKTGFVSFHSMDDGSTITEYYSGGSTTDASNASALLPGFSAKLVHYQGDLSQGEFFFIEDCKLNRKIEDSDFALSAPAGTNVFYSGDMLPGQDGANRNALAHMALQANLSDVRTLLPELRKRFERQRGETAFHVGVPEKKEEPIRIRWHLLAVNGFLAIAFFLIWRVRARRRPAN